MTDELERMWAAQWERMKEMIRDGHFDGDAWERFKHRTISEQDRLDDEQAKLDQDLVDMGRKG